MEIEDKCQYWHYKEVMAIKESLNACLGPKDIHIVNGLGFINY